jgi:hypothetical protein
MSARAAANKAILLDFIVLSGIWKTEKCINCGAKAPVLFAFGGHG